MHITRSIRQPIRKDITWGDKWERDDRGIIYSWERGREMREQQPELAHRAKNGELVTLPWKGGTEGLDPPKPGKKESARYGSLRYLAMWQGLRNEDLNVASQAETRIKCTKSDRDVIFTPTVPSSDT